MWSNNDGMDPNWKPMNIASEVYVLKHKIAELEKQLRSEGYEYAVLSERYLEALNKIKILQKQIEKNQDE